MAKRSSSNFSDTGQIRATAFKPKSLDYFLYKPKLKAQARSAALQVAGQIDHNTLGVHEKDMPIIGVMAERSLRERDKYTDMLLSGKDFTNEDVNGLTKAFLESKPINKSIQEAQRNSQRIEKTRAIFEMAALREPEKASYYSGRLQDALDSFKGTFSTPGKITEFNITDGPGFIDMADNLDKDLRVAASKMTPAARAKIKDLNIRTEAVPDKNTGKVWLRYFYDKPKDTFENFSAIDEVLNDHMARVNNPDSEEGQFLSFMEKYDPGYTKNLSSTFQDRADYFKRSEERASGITFGQQLVDMPTDPYGGSPLMDKRQPDITTHQSFNTDLPLAKKSTDKAYQTPGEEERVVDTDTKFFGSFLKTEVYTDNEGRTRTRQVEIPRNQGVVSLGKREAVVFNNKAYSEDISKMYDAFFSNPDITVDDFTDIYTSQSEDNIFRDPKYVNPSTFKRLHKAMNELKVFSGTKTPLQVTANDISSRRGKKIRELKDDINEIISDTYKARSAGDRSDIYDISFNVDKLMGVKPGKGDEAFRQELSKRMPSLHSFSFLRDESTGELVLDGSSTVSDKENRKISAGEFGEGSRQKDNIATMLATGEFGDWELKNYVVADAGTKISNLVDSETLSAVPGFQVGELDNTMTNALKLRVNNTKTGENAIILVNNPFKALRQPIADERSSVAEAVTDPDGSEYPGEVGPIIHQINKKLTKNGMKMDFYLGNPYEPNQRTKITVKKKDFRQFDIFREGQEEPIFNSSNRTYGDFISRLNEIIDSNNKIVQFLQHNQEQFNKE